MGGLIQLLQTAWRDWGELGLQVHFHTKREQNLGGTGWVIAGRALLLPHTQLPLAELKLG